VSFVKRSANYGGLVLGYPDPIDDMDRDSIGNVQFITHYSTIGIHDSSWKLYENGVADANNLEPKFKLK
jgi:hypothetical protein